MRGSDIFNWSPRRKREEMDLTQSSEDMIADNPLIQDALQSPNRIYKNKFSFKHVTVKL